MNPVNTHGAFSWSELQTSDPEAAHKFYSHLFGWTPEPLDTELGPYMLMKAGKAPACGIMALPSEGIPPNWSFYVTVDDVDATMAKATELGGTVILEPMDLPNVGRFCGIQDPQGAVIFAIKYAYLEHEPEVSFQDAFSHHGAFSWWELRTRDPEAVKSFYEALFGWTIEVIMMGMGPYYVIKVGEVGAGGMVAHPDENIPPHWGGYVTVDDADAVAEKASAGGGSVLMPPMDLPEVGRFTIVMDPQGAAITAITYLTVVAGDE